MEVVPSCVVETGVVVVDMLGGVWRVVSAVAIVDVVFNAVVIDSRKVLGDIGDSSDRHKRSMKAAIALCKH